MQPSQCQNVAQQHHQTVFWVLLGYFLKAQRPQKMLSKVWRRWQKQWSRRWDACEHMKTAVANAWPDVVGITNKWRTARGPGKLRAIELYLILINEWLADWEPQPSKRGQIFRSTTCSLGIHGTGIDVYAIPTCNIQKERLLVHECKFLDATCYLRLTYTVLAA